MKNKVYYIKPENSDFTDAIRLGLRMAFSIIARKRYSNIKLILSHRGFIKSSPNFISQALDNFFSGDGVRLLNLLKRNGGFSISDFPNEGQTIEIKLLFANNNLIFNNENTVVVLVFADFYSFKKIQSLLSYRQIDLIAVVQTETDSLNELLSASKAQSISNTPDFNITPYK